MTRILVVSGGKAVQRESEIDGRDWAGIFYLGLPRKVIGDAYKSGFIHDRKEDGRLLPIAWVAREDATDYVGFLKKSLLTLHNELTKALGGMPVHGSMITITFINGLRKTLVFSADSGTGKSETTTAMMEAMVTGSGLASELKQIDILAGDMLSLWRGEDGQLYAFGTETGDFLRLPDSLASHEATQEVSRLCRECPSAPFPFSVLFPSIPFDVSRRTGSGLAQQHILERGR